MHHEALRTCLMRCRSVGVLRRKTAGAALKPARYYQTGALLLGQCATRAALIDLRLVAHERHFGAVLFSKNKGTDRGGAAQFTPIYFRG